MGIGISVFVGVVTTLVGGTLLFFAQRFFNQQSKREEVRDQQKMEENALILQSLDALGKLAVANSIALRDGKTNGELAEALKEYKTVEKRLHKHLIAVDVAVNSD